jgi:hypothetical protein
MTEPHQYRLQPAVAKQALQQWIKDTDKGLDDVVVHEQTIYGLREFTLRELIIRALDEPEKYPINPNHQRG